MKEIIKEYLLLAIPLIILLVFSVWQYFNIFSGQTCFFLRYFPDCGPGLTDPYILVMALFAIFFSLIVFYRKNFDSWFSSRGLDSKHIIIAAVLALILAFLTNQFASGDLEYYFNVGRAVHNNINPYVQSWAGGNQFYSDATQTMSAGVMYGPLLLRAFSWVYALSFGNIYLFVLIIKVFCLLLFLLSGYVMMLLARKFGNKNNNFLAGWFLAPIILIEWLANGHFDGIWLFLVLLSYYLAVKKKWWLVFPILTIAVWLKFVPVLFGPVLILWWWQDFDLKSFKAIKEMAIATILSLIITFISWWGLWAGTQSLQGIILQSKWAAHSIFYFMYYGIAELIGSDAEIKYHYLLSGGLQLLLIFFALWLLYPLLVRAIGVLLRREKMFPLDYFRLTFIGLAVFIFVIQKSVWPWYVIWLLPFGLICRLNNGDKKFNNLLAWLGAGPLLFYCLWFYGDNMLGNYWFFTCAMLAISIYPLYLLISLRSKGYRLVSDINPTK